MDLVALSMTNSTSINRLSSRRPPSDATVVPILGMVSVFRNLEPAVYAYAGHIEDNRMDIQERSKPRTTSRVVGLLEAAALLGPNSSEQIGALETTNSSAIDSASITPRSTNAESVYSTSSDGESSGTNFVGESNRSVGKLFVCSSSVQRSRSYCVIRRNIYVIYSPYILVFDTLAA